MNVYIYYKFMGMLAQTKLRKLPRSQAIKKSCWDGQS